MKQEHAHRHFHAMRADHVCAVLNTDEERGLSLSEAKHRHEIGGANELPHVPPRTFLHIFLQQFTGVLMLVIVVAAIASFLIGHVVDGVFISVVVLLNALLSALQETKAERALDVLRNALTFRATVVRDGAHHEIDSRDIVVGDIVVVGPGSRIPADGRIVYAHNLLVSEAALSGESQPIAKKSEPIDVATIVTDRVNMLYAGTTVEDGSAMYVVTAIGADTEMGKIATLIDQQTERLSPLQVVLARLARWITVFVLVSVGLFIFFGLMRGQELGAIVLAAIALVVGTIPEGLLPAVTVVLVLGMRRLAKEKALVRRLRAVETMGAVSVICMDKTGTLTTGEMRLRCIVTPDDIVRDDGAYTTCPCSDVQNASCTSLHKNALMIGFLVNDATVENPDDEAGAWVVHGRPTDRALVLAGLHAGLRHATLLSHRTLVDQVLFSSARKYALRVYATDTGTQETYMLGALEHVLSACTHMALLDGVREMTPSMREKVRAYGESTTKNGYRLLACAWRNDEQINKKACAQEMVFAGFLALRDPVRTDVQEALITAQRAGVRPLVITGDHRNTAIAILADVGMDVEREHVYNGSDVDKLSDNELLSIVKDAQLFARVSPAHKIRIVRALMRRGDVVAMVGDGVNDAPALKAADVGIAIGSGTDLAKTVADIVLLDDSFNTIVRAIRQGRLVFLNIKRVIFFLLIDDFTELILFFAALFAGVPLPLLPAQILWINLIEDGLPGMALTASRGGAHLMRHAPRRLSEAFFSRSLVLFALIVFVVSSVSALGIFFGALAYGIPIEEVRTMLFILMSMDSLLFAYIMHTFDTPLLSRHAFTNTYLNGAVILSLIILLVGLSVPFVRNILSVATLSLSQWMIVVSVLIVEIVTLEIAKRLFVRA